MTNQSPETRQTSQGINSETANGWEDLVNYAGETPITQNNTENTDKHTPESPKGQRVFTTYSDELMCAFETIIGILRAKGDGKSMLSDVLNKAAEVYILQQKEIHGEEYREMEALNRRKWGLDEPHSKSPEKQEKHHSLSFRVNRELMSELMILAEINETTYGEVARKAISESVLEYEAEYRDDPHYTAIYRAINNNAVKSLLAKDSTDDSAKVRLKSPEKLERGYVIGTNVDDELLSRLKAIAIMNGATGGDIMREAIEKYVSKCKSDPRYAETTAKIVERMEKYGPPALEESEENTNQLLKHSTRWNSDNKYGDRLQKLKEAQPGIHNKLYEVAQTSSLEEYSIVATDTLPDYPEATVTAWYHIFQQGTNQ